MQKFTDIANRTILPPSHISTLVKKDGNTFDIIREILATDTISRNDTAAFAPALKGKDLLETLSNVWHFVKRNIRYKLDPIGQQFVKTPSRTWSDKYADCKSYSIFIASLLKNLGVPFSYRFTSYIQGGDFTHVYIVVPYQGSEIIIDDVMPAFNRQKPFARKKDIPMTQISRLSGIGESSYATKIIDLGPKSIGEISEGEMDLLIARDRLVTERDIVDRNKGIGSLTSEKYGDSIDMIDSAIHAVNEYISGVSDDIDTDLALIARQAVSGEFTTAHEIMGIGATNRNAFRAQKKQRLYNKRAAIKRSLPQSTKDNIWGIAELSGNNNTVGFLKKVAKKVKAAVKTVAKTAGKAAKATGKVAAKAGKTYVKVAKKVVKAAVKVATAPLRLIAKGILEVALPKAAPFFLYLFITDPKLLAKMPAKVQAKRKKSEKIANFIVNGIGMKRDHFMGIVRNGIMKHYGKSPENVIAAMTKGVSGIGVIPVAVITALISIIQKIAKAKGQKGESASAADAPDASDFGSIVNTVVANKVAQEVKQQPENRSALNTDSENPDMPLSASSQSSSSDSAGAQNIQDSTTSSGTSGSGNQANQVQPDSEKDDFPAGGKRTWSSL